MSPLLNYTTTVAVEKSVGEIQAALAKAGAKSIQVDYTSGQPAAIRFVTDTAFGDRAFALPANVEAVFKTLMRQGDRRQVPRRLVTREQAARVAWRIVKDWTEAQLAIIQTGMVTIDEVMLPYMLVQKGKTFYLAAVESRLALPEPREEAQ